MRQAAIGFSSLLAAFALFWSLTDAVNPTGIKRSVISMRNHGYEGVLVAISERINETQADKLISRIKQYLSDTSFYLFEATNRRVYIRSITIVVPESWTNNNKYQLATGEFFQNANILIDDPNPLVGDSPYVKRTTSCGHDGDYMHITQNFMLKSLFDIYKDFGYPGPTIAHEWGHLRWGLFDEYALPAVGFPKFYFDSNGKVAATKCGKHMRGKILIPGTSIACPINPFTGLPDHRCVFIADSSNIGVNASVMFYHFLSEVTAFCDNDEKNKMTLHNEEAPNAHNDFCSGQSAWQIMKKHRDFANGNNPPIPISQPVDTTPTFRIVQAQPMRAVLILDVSGSMAGTKLSKLRQATAEYILNMVPDGTEIGLMKFSTRANILCDLTAIRSARDRADLVKKLPKNIEGGTAIGRALQLGMKMLERANKNPAGGVLLVVTDGEENRTPYIQSVRSDLIRKRVVLNAVLISKSGENRLIALSRVLNGVSNFDSGNENSTALTSAFRATFAAQGSWGKPGDTRVEILSRAISVNEAETTEVKVSVDSSVGRETEWLFTYPYSQRQSPLVVTLVSPSRLKFTSGGPHAEDRNGLQQLVIKVPGISETGDWLARVQNVISTAIVSRITVTSSPPTDDMYPIETRAYINKQMIDFKNNSTPLPVLMKAEVYQGYLPIVGAHVRMRAGNAPWQRMRDDGAGADDIRNDGVYSGYLWKISANGKQQVMVSVDGRTSSRQTPTAAISAAFPRARLETNESLDTTVTDEEASSTFQRTAAAGLVNVNGWTPDLDLKQFRVWPPGRVNTLELVSVFVSNWSVAFRWSHVDDPDEEDTEPKYILRYSKDVRQLRTNFEKCTAVRRRDVVRGNMANPANGVSVRFPVLHRNSTLFFGVKVQRGTRTSALSNVVSASFVSLISQAKSKNSTIAKTTAKAASETTAKPAAEPSAEPSAETTAKTTTKTTFKATDKPTAKTKTETASNPTAKPIVTTTAKSTAKPIVTIAKSTVKPVDTPAKSTVKAIMTTTAKSTAKPIMTTTAKSTLKPIMTTTTTTTTAKSTIKPIVTTTAKSTVRPTVKTTIKITVKPADQPTTKTTAKTTGKPSTKTTTKMTGKPSAKTTITTTATPTAKPTVKPTTKTTTKPTAKTTTKTAAKPTAKSISTTTGTATAKTTVKTVKPTGRTSTKTTSKPTAKTRTRTTAKPIAGTNAVNISLSNGDASSVTRELTTDNLFIMSRTENTTEIVELNNSDLDSNTTRSSTKDGVSSNAKILLLKICIGVGLALLSLAAIVVAVTFRSKHKQRRNSSRKDHRRFKNRTDPRDYRSRSLHIA